MINMNLNSVYFDYIKNGTKRIELRLYDEKRSKIKLNDLICFTNNETKEELKVKVIGLLRYNNFKSIINDFDISIFSSEEMKKDKLINTLNEIYGKEKEEKYGVLGIRFDII